MPDWLPTYTKDLNSATLLQSLFNRKSLKTASRNRQRCVAVRCTKLYLWQAGKRKQTGNGLGQ